MGPRVRGGFQKYRNASAKSNNRIGGRMEEREGKRKNAAAGATC